jgi:hypothetical protein
MGVMSTVISFPLGSVEVVGGPRLIGAELVEPECAVGAACADGAPHWYGLG